MARRTRRVFSAQAKCSRLKHNRGKLMEKEELIEIIIKDIIKLPYEVQEKLIEKYEVNRNEKDS